MVLALSAPVYAGPLPAPLTVEDFPSVNMEQAALGQLLFYDKILSGNRNINCAACHHPRFGSSDGLPLGIGEGGVGLGPERTGGEGHSRIVRRVPRNAPGLWNLGAHDVNILMYDGRISIADTFNNGFNTPAEEWLPEGLDSLLAVQALFPLTSDTEMAGHSEENEVAGAVNDRIDYGWPIIAKRVRTIPEYGAAFVSAFDHIERADQVTIVDIANAIGAFETIEFISIDSPFDQYLAGDQTALTAQQQRGLDLFYGEAGCDSCHSGPLLSDQEFHALGLPPFGPGRTRRFDLMNRDVGRLGESDALDDAYKFRTPMLRNVALTAPYGHNGAYKTLEEIVRHHVEPWEMLDNWTPESVGLPDVPWLAPFDFLILQDSMEIARQVAVIPHDDRPLPDDQIDDLVAFLNALTGSASQPFGSPDTVPSGLPLD